MQAVTRRPTAAKSRSSVRYDAGEAGYDRVATRRRHAALVLDWLGWRTENSIDSFASPNTGDEEARTQVLVWCRPAVQHENDIIGREVPTQLQLDPANYTVGWICAISIEYLAAQLCLDEQHERPEHVSRHDNNDYTLGRVGKHNVVIAVLPDGEYGTSSAQASQEICCIASQTAPRDGEGGVLQYDFGKTIQDQSFRQTAFLNRPPTVLLTAVSGLKTQYQMKRYQLGEAIKLILQKEEDLRDELGRPNASSDRLYRSNFVHPLDKKNSCVEVCGVDPSNLIKRPERMKQPQSPVVHYGLIASANQLMKDALVRDRLAAEMDVLCFEMEAAGLMNHFPCLVIRGICDYSDSHKNKEWQGYAAIVAAAYAKDLLYRIAPNRVEAEKKIGDILSGLHEAAEEHLDIAKRHHEVAEENRDLSKGQLQAQKDLDKERLSKDEQKEEQNDATYEWYKGRVEERIEGTCLWLLNHKHFQSWLKQESGPLLVTADPGCGKSVLAKYLIDHALPRSTTICYFFFKDQDQNTIREALCALLHQLFSQKPIAIKDPQAGPITIVLDALDECAESEFADLMRNIRSQSSDDQLGYGKLKYLLTCRPYKQIVSYNEVNCVIMHRVNQLSEKKSLSYRSKSHLEKKLREATHRTHLWVYLVFDYLEKGNFKKTQKGVDSTIAILPKSVNEAYEQILNKSKEHAMARKALSIILAAHATSESIHDLDLEDEEDFKWSLGSWCRLFVSICHGKIYFLHQTAREFLLASPITVSSGLHWRHSINIQQAHAVLAEVCVLYLNFFNSDVSLPADANGAVNSYAFLDYSAQTWGAHFRNAGIVDDAAIISFALGIFNPDSKSYSVWFGIYWKTTSIRATEYFTDLMLASYYGHHVIVKLLLKKGANVEAKGEYGRTPLSWAVGNVRTASVKLLLEKGADVEAKDEYGRTPLWWAAKNESEASVKLLLERGADFEAKDSEYGQTPLSWAAENGHGAIVRLLLEKGADVECEDEDGRTPLSRMSQTSECPKNPNLSN
ncbi:hypothetical protein B0J13DRAFT_589089 [Dactylonectria estremocensis]|uniref:Nucleoside phosphorylase domain-containing protein n=1 Tax=Dactylonectria estremocensis TaxID=1079267 RepID=A0A9P9DU51_9HYPO|nr:hypothetical protein B0J13DRAFT_589089 [Dactylonectria estremocensis]